MSETPKRSTRGKRRLFGDKDDDKDGPPQSIASSSFAARERLVTTTIAETPQKKTKKTSNHESFFSPKKGKPFVTPDKLEDVDDVDDEDDDIVEVGSPPWKKTRLSDQFSPVKATKKAEDSPYIPTYIHKNLTYKRQGDASLPDKVVKTFRLVCQHYEIPDDFETNRSYGPLSGISYEERAISAYSLGLLDHKPGDEGIEICSNCVTVGHKRNDCPQLI
jgi:hypothetical protein